MAEPPPKITRSYFHVDRGLQGGHFWGCLSLIPQNWRILLGKNQGGVRLAPWLIFFHLQLRRFLFSTTQNLCNVFRQALKKFEQAKEDSCSFSNNNMQQHPHRLWIWKPGLKVYFGSVYVCVFSPTPLVERDPIFPWDHLFISIFFIFFSSTE